MKPAVHQFLPNFAGRDAIGHHTLVAQRLLREAGFESDIYAGIVDRDFARLATAYGRFAGARPGQPAWLLYQCSTGSKVAEFCAARPEPLVVDYHNITPAEHFEAWEPAVAVELRAGRRQVSELAAATSYALADSAYNAEELLAFGYRQARVVPILVDFSTFDGQPDRQQLAVLQAERARRATPVDWLFVGRLAPNKAQHDIVKAFAWYTRVHNPDARLHLVGRSSSHRYETALRKFIAALGLTGKVELAMSVSHDALLAYFQCTDAFVCLSEHEGLCVPLLEAMHHGVPVVAYSATAVPETLGSGGLLLEDKAPALVAACVDRLVSDRQLRAQVVEAGDERVADFALGRTSKLFLDSVAEFTDGQL